MYFSWTRSLSAAGQGIKCQLVGHSGGTPLALVVGAMASNLLAMASTEHSILAPSGNARSHY